MTERGSDIFRMGSNYEGASEMFKTGDGEKESKIDIVLEREKRDIFSDAQTRFEKVLEERDMEQVRDFPGGEYPSLDEWVEFRVEHGRGTNFFPCFVRGKESGDISFMKVQISRSSKKVEALQYEYDIMTKARPGIGEPRALEFYQPEPGKENELAFLRMEAIPFEEGRVGLPEEWTVDHARDASSKIKSLENMDVSEEVKTLSRFDKFPEGVEVVIGRNLAKCEDNLRQAGIDVEKVRNIVSAEIRKVFVHGDFNLKNSIICKDGTIKEVDWELAGQGFLGQDAGKLFTELRTNKEAQQVFLQAYCYDESGELDEERKRSLFAGIIAENLTHLAYRVERLGDPQKVKYHEIFRKELPKYYQAIVQAIERFEGT